MPKPSAHPARVYIVRIGTAVKIVRANSAAAARNHAIDGMVSVECATAAELADLVTQGVRIEIAGQPSPAQAQANTTPPPQPGPATDTDSTNRVDHQPG